RAAADDDLREAGLRGPAAGRPRRRRHRQHHHHRRPGRARAGERAAGVSAPPERLAAALAGRYTLEREIGQGGMATVWLARDLRHDREVALKVLRPELTAILGAERFLNEVRITARLDHPHILTLIDSGADEGLLWYVVPYIRGESLRQ